MLNSISTNINVKTFQNFYRFLMQLHSHSHLCELAAAEDQLRLQAILLTVIEHSFMYSCLSVWTFSMV